MLHETCEEGRRLLQSYLAAIDAEEALKVKPAGAPAIRLAQSKLYQIRNRYWRHVYRHKCRMPPV